jgi:hypothetical protein
LSNSASIGGILRVKSAVQAEEVTGREGGVKRGKFKDESPLIDAPMDILPQQLGSEPVKNQLNSRCIRAKSPRRRSFMY